MIEEVQVRREKLERLTKLGIDAYPKTHRRDASIGLIQASFDEFVAQGKTVTVGGRVMAVRVHGGLAFADLVDETGKIQLSLKEEALNTAFTVFCGQIDPGDILEATGIPFLTKRGERSIAVSEWTILAKALRPLPDKWHGLQDVEARYRHRELDLITSSEVKNTFIVRSKLVQSMRRFLDERGFLEVETPMLHPIPGGANAKPFITHHNALDIDLYLRIAPELYLKRLIVGGFEKIYEVARCFRNEGISPMHNPEFTQIELYWAFVGQDFLGFLEQMLVTMMEQAIGSTKVTRQGHELDFSAPWSRKTFREIVLESCGIDVNRCFTSEDVLKEVATAGLKIDFRGCIGLGEHLDQLYKKTARPAVVQPTWVLDYPVEMKPLANRSAADSTKAAVAQLVVMGGEIVNAYYYELNDPIDQRHRFEEEEKLASQGSEEAQRIDEDFLMALEQGMPPTSGMGMGIDRLVALLTDSPSLKEVIFFPTLRPVEHSGSEMKKSSQTQVAHSVLLDDGSKPRWSLLNTAAHLGASFAAREGKKLIRMDTTETKDGEAIQMNIQHAIMMKRAADSAALHRLKQEAEAQGLRVVCLTQAMQDSTNDQKVKTAHAETLGDQTKYLGVLVFGGKKEVEQLTQTFSLLE
ncbi:lysine--tRNA ligase [Patescibacteria group bacterium]|nr:lysine--tRNA ligase [Patescibacteria group bacterium]